LGSKLKGKVAKGAVRLVGSVGPSGLVELVELAGPIAVAVVCGAVLGLAAAKLGLKSENSRLQRISTHTRLVAPTRSLIAVSSLSVRPLAVWSPHVCQRPRTVV
jgi:hypothetical protein